MAYNNTYFSNAIPRPWKETAGDSNSGNNFFTDIRNKGISSFNSKISGRRAIGDQYADIAENGIYGGEKGVNKISNSAARASQLRARYMAKGIRRSVGKRIGPNSGATLTAVLNKAYAPALTEIAGQKANLLAGNEQSKLAGLAGGLDYEKFLYQLQKDADSKGGGGILGFLKGALPLVAAIPGIGSALGLGAAATGATKVWD